MYYAGEKLNDDEKNKWYKEKATPLVYLTDRVLASGCSSIHASMFVLHSNLDVLIYILDVFVLDSVKYVIK